MTGETETEIAQPSEPMDREVDWDRVGTPRDIVAILKALGLNARWTAEQTRRAGIERFCRQVTE